ncbi:hypothetical protein [Nocardia sp. NPDC046763]|uniref:hypothetical protein n=1 Tax=Nocardia sp. NPDC046763 TaxID=3155256 RepID=UPI0033DB4994
MDPFIAGILVIIVYDVIGVAVAKVLYPRRHGIGIKIINGGMDAAPALPIVLLWPLWLAIPSLRNPELCRHPHHILARDEARARMDYFRAAAERDERYR